MEVKIKKIQEETLAEISAAENASTLHAIHVRVLGRSGSISLLNQMLKKMSKEERPCLGKLLGDVRKIVSMALKEREDFLREEQDAHAVQQPLPALDCTLPGTTPAYGAVHPITGVLHRAVAVFRRMGFSLFNGPDIETEWHCFDALNTPSDHPARNEQNTFYLRDGRLLRPHTSTIQTRVMTHQIPPVRIIGTGAAYRRDEADTKHLVQFHQLEGLYISSNVDLSDLKGTVAFFFRELLGQETGIRFRPHFFPFTVPSYEIDIRSKIIGEHWLELAGCGMVDPAVLETVCVTRRDHAYNPEIVSGFAFGIGLERLTMAITGIPDIRMLVENDIRFFTQFR